MATVNGAPLRASATAAWATRCSSPAFPYDTHGPELVELFGQFLGRARRAPVGIGGARPPPVTSPRDGSTHSGAAPAVGRGGRALVVTEAGGRITDVDGAAFDARAGHLVAVGTASCTMRCSR
jgi:hypothetical protein